MVEIVDRMWGWSVKYNDNTGRQRDRFFYTGDWAKLEKFVEQLGQR